MSSKKNKERKRRGLPDEAVLKLLTHSYASQRYRQIMSDLLRLALLTGARIEELCALKYSNVHKREDGYWLEIEGGKTDAAKREVPLHPAGVSIVERRLKDKDNHLFAGLTPGGPDHKRSWHVSKAYGRFREDAGVAKRGQDFHALRNTFISCMEGLEVPESTTKLIVGHARGSMTYGLYSQGQRVDLRRVIGMLDYGAEIMEAICNC